MTAKVTLLGAWRPPLGVGEARRAPSDSLPLSLPPSDCGRVSHALLKQPQPPEDEALCYR